MEHHRHQAQDQAEEHAATGVPEAWSGPGVTVTDLPQAGPAGVPGWFARPARPGPVPAVVLVHPAGGWDRRCRIPAADTLAEKDVFLFDDLAASLLRAGVGVVGFDARFITARRTDGWDPGRVTFPGLVQDVVALLRYLRAHPAVDEHRVTLLGVSLGTLIAVAAAAEEQRAGAGAPCRLVLAAPGAVSLDQHLAWTLVGRRLEWLLAAGLVARDGTVDLARAAALHADRAGWWDDFTPAHFTPAEPADRPAASVSYEQVAGTLMHRHHEYTRALFSIGNDDAPAEYWRSWREFPPMAETFAGLRGRVRLHVGDEDWTSAPRHSWLLAQSAPKDLEVQVTVHPDLGHLFSRRDASGRLTHGPIHPTALAALTASVLE
ncbi:MAG TPA: acetylxylan esterase [Actinocrinis sp.]|nr:acetylxylan esterase [Actinocrinis sp.]